MKPTARSELINFINQAISSDGNNTDLNHIDTSLITAMNGLFKDKGLFNGDISGWDTLGSTINKNRMFLNSGRESNLPTWCSLGSKPCN